MFNFIIKGKYMNFDTLIPFCSYDYQFINRTIEGVRKVSDNIIITYCDHLFNGSPENLDLIDKVIKDNTDCKFIKINYDKTKDSRWHHNYTRWLSTNISNSKYVLYLDSDEVFESDKLLEWVRFKKDFPDVCTFSNYWYFRSEKYQAKTYEDSPVLVNRKFINIENAFHGLERAIYKYIDSNKKEFKIMGLDGNPMCHHYSWAMNKEDMLRKTQNWGHDKDRDWAKLIEEEFSRDFNGKDFVHGFEYNILK
jgi:hypothetical protein